MKSNIEIFDKNGNALDIADVIGRFLHEQTEHLDEVRDIEDFTIGLENRFDDKGRQILCIYNANFKTLDSKYVNVL